MINKYYYCVFDKVSYTTTFNKLIACISCRVMLFIKIVFYFVKYWN